MAQQGTSLGAGSGPGNKWIATTLLELLAVRGRVADAERVTRALDLGPGGLSESPVWLEAARIDDMFAAAGVDAPLARAVGHRLTEPDATGLRLYGLGLATPEKAYRRIQALLPREAAEASWTSRSIREGHAEIEFRPAGEGAPMRSAQAACALRVGQLEAIPGLFGLLPARVSESSCVARGSDACRYVVRWDRTARLGVIHGAGAGLGLVAGVGAAILWLGAPLVPGVICAGLGLTAAIALGRVFDLHRQLEAVAGARRGHLALFDQVDAELAAKLDALARAESSLEGSGPSARRIRTRGLDETPAEPGPARADPAIVQAAHEIHAAAGDLACWFEARGHDALPTGADAEAQAASSPSRDSIVDARGALRRIRQAATRIAARSGAAEGACVQETDLARLVARGCAAARTDFAAGVELRTDSEADLRRVPCDPLQIEALLIELLRNAVEASRGLSDRPEIFLTLRNVSRGVELAVEDRGVGLEASAIDEVFDPFFGDAASDSNAYEGLAGEAAVADGEHDDPSTGLRTPQRLGLPGCLRIVEQHGGELRIESEDRPGTRVCILLPGEAPKRSEKV